MVFKLLYFYSQKSVKITQIYDLNWDNEGTPCRDLLSDVVNKKLPTRTVWYYASDRSIKKGSNSKPVGKEKSNLIDVKSKLIIIKSKLIDDTTPWVTVFGP